jgi:membrane associated rhomboid family serine protease
MPDMSQVPPSKPTTQPMFNVPAIVLGVIAVLVSVHFALWTLGPNWEASITSAFAFIPVRLGGGDPIPYPHGAQIWTFFTYALLHADMFHLGSNSIWLLIFSTPVARRLGTWRYLLLLAGSAVAGAAATLVTHWGEFVVIIGASASVSGVLAAAIPIIFATGFRMGAAHLVDYRRLSVLRPFQVVQNRNALSFTGLFLAVTLFTGATMTITQTAFLQERNIAWEAHLGGFIAGLVLFYLLDKKPFR